MPHSEIHGSKLIRSSPRLFAAYHVLHRLCMPRHPPNALTTLNRSHCQCSSSRCPFQRNSNRPGYLLQPSQSNNAIDVFDLITLLELRRAARLCQVLRPASRDLIRYRAVRQRQSSRPSDVIPRDDKQQRPRATSFLPTSSPSTISGRLGHPWFHKNWARTSDKIRHLEASRSIFSSRYMQNRHRR